MAAQQTSDAEPVETFLGQADRYTHSGLKLSDCFSRTAFELVFKYGTILQMSAARQALIAALITSCKFRWPIVALLESKTKSCSKS